jgi:small subunit ribosomal protein S18
MAFNRKKNRRKRRPRRKVCPFCADKMIRIDYKNIPVLERFITERGKIISSRITGVCSAHQRKLSLEIKRARNIAMLPYTVLD